MPNSQGITQLILCTPWEVHAANNGDQQEEDFRDVQFLIEVWRTRKVEEKEDGNPTVLTRRTSSDFLRKLALFEHKSDDVLHGSTNV